MYELFVERHSDRKGKGYLWDELPEYELKILVL